MSNKKSLRDYLTENEEAEYKLKQLSVISKAREAGLIPTYTGRNDEKYMDKAHQLAELASFRFWLDIYLTSNNIEITNKSILEHTNIDMYTLFYKERKDKTQKLKAEKENELNEIRIKAGIIKPNQPQTIDEQKVIEETPKTFEELFYKPELIKPCINILKELDPPFIDTDCNYIGRLKGIICVWIDELQRQGIVKKYSDRKLFASLIPQKINRFSIDESMFGKPQIKANNLYRTDIKTMVSDIRLSQNSQ